MQNIVVKLKQSLAPYLYLFVWYIKLLDSELVVQKEGIIREHLIFRSLLYAPHTLIMTFFL